MPLELLGKNWTASGHPGAPLEKGQPLPPISAAAPGGCRIVIINSCTHDEMQRTLSQQAVLGTLYKLPSHANLCSDVRPVPRELPRAPGLGPN